MKKLLFFLMFVGFLMILYWFLTAPRSGPVYLSPQDQISKAKKPNEHEVMPLIRQINARNEKIHSLYVKEVSIKVKHRITVHATGEMAMERIKKFRLIVTHRLTGKEMDVGSNDTIFWFWSKRMDPPDLHYAKHEDLGKAMLKRALNPSWMLESLNMGGIKTENIEIGKFKNFWAVFQPRTSATGEKVTVVTLIEPTRPAIAGRYLYGADEKMIASAEIQEYFEEGGIIIPKSLVIIWYDEGLVMEWTLIDPKINAQIPENYWVMPTMKNSIDMAK